MSLILFLGMVAGVTSAVQSVRHARSVRRVRPQSAGDRFLALRAEQHGR